MVVSRGKTIAVIQARYESRRLPGKVMLPLGEQSILGGVISSIRAASLVDEIWLATSDREVNNVLEAEGRKLGVHVFRGSEEDVLDRYYRVALESRPEAIVRVTADNPFTYHGFIDGAIRALYQENYDYSRFIDIPVGSGVEVFRFHALEQAKEKASSDAEREHITLYLNNHRDDFRLGLIEAEPGLRRPDIRLTVDTEEDYMLSRAIVYFLGEGIRDLSRIIELIEQQPWLKYINSNVEQHEPARQSNGQVESS